MTAHPRTKYRHLPKGLEVLYEDNAIIVIDKPPGMLTIATDKEKERTAYFALTDYVRKGNARSSRRVFIVHRLDRETSGICIFAKTEEAKRCLQDHWEETSKKYLAVVHGTLPVTSGNITSCLAENKAHLVYSTEDREKGKIAHTNYRVLGANGGLSLLMVDLLTGRKHQIRVHMADNGTPVVGDSKYGKKGDVHKRMALHAFSISFRHPVSGKECYFETGVPKYFNSLVTSSFSSSLPAA